MILQDLLFVDYSLRAAGFLVLLWVTQKIIDKIADRLIQRKIFAPIADTIWRRIKIFRTRADPVKATFELSFTPEEDLTINTAVDRLETTFTRLEDISNGKVSIESQHWDKHERTGKVSVVYENRTDDFDIDVKLVRDTQSLRETPSGTPDDVLVGSIGMKVNFKFPFNLIEDTLFNLSSLTSYAEQSFNDQMRGSFSGGRFIISPVKDNLTIDEWIKQEKFDISLLLSTDENGTEVEFFSDRAVVKSAQRQIDAQTVKYMKELLLNYYL